MKRLLALWLFALSLVQSALAQNYQFQNSMSREVLDNYLDRAITMQGQSEVHGDLLLSETGRQQNIAMLNDIGAKFVGRIGGWWDSGRGQGLHDALFAKVQQNTYEIHANDPQVICQAAVLEYVNDAVGAYAIPDRVFREFGLPVTNRTFNYGAMLYPAPASRYKIYNGNDMREDQRAWMPDITQLETQMWFYYMATRYISADCEAIHFGQTEVMSRRDVGNKQWWSLLQRVRTYAKSNARRGLVLCDAHVAGIGTYYEPNLSLTIDQWQTYVPTQDWQKQLLWDFHSQPTNYTEASGCTTSRQPVTLNPQSNTGLYLRSLGGRNPQGWLCRRNPFLVELDNGVEPGVTGCNHDRPWTLWGWDEISWFALQDESYRNRILSYTYNKVKCIDPNGHFEMPGMRGVTPFNNQPTFLYRANTGIHNQQVTIKNIWSGYYAPGQNWVKHNFSDEQVIYSPGPGIASSNLILVGNNRMYYIGTDSRIHAYIKYNGTWLTTSPSYAAGNVSGQMTASSAPGSLVANPSGTALYYRGTDGFIYQFQIGDDWTYTYSSMPSNSSVRAVGSLVCPTDGRIYYIAAEPSNGNAQRVHGFIKYGSTWLTVSPTWASSNAANQASAAGDLVANPSGTALYYRGTDGFIYQFQIGDDWTYTYSSMPSNSSVRAVGSLVCPTDGRIYYIAAEPSNGNAQRVHGFIKYGSTWLTVSPSSASSNLPSQSQTQARAGSLSCSPNNTTIAYIGDDAQMHGFTISNDWQYTYFNFKTALIQQAGAGATSFSSQNALFYISGGQQLSDAKIYQYVYEADYCGSTSVQSVDPGCCNYSRAAATAVLTAAKVMPLEISSASKSIDNPSTALQLSIYPNPVHEVLTVVADGIISRIVLTGPEGRTYFRHTYAEAPKQVQVLVSDLPAGLYFVEATVNGTAIMKKVIISK